MKKRITIPEGKAAIVLPAQLGSELLALLRQVRRAGKVLIIEQPHRDIAGDVILAMFDSVGDAELAGNPILGRLAND